MRRHIKDMKGSTKVLYSANAKILKSEVVKINTNNNMKEHIGIVCARIVWKLFGYMK